MRRINDNTTNSESVAQVAAITLSEVTIGSEGNVDAFLNALAPATELELA